MKLSIKLREKLNLEIEGVINRYREMSATNLAKMFGINMNAKNAFNALARKIISNSESNLLIDLLSDADFRIKTVRLDEYGQLKESMSLPVFKYLDIHTESWDTSELRDYFCQKVFAFVVFRAKGKELYLNKIIFWEMPENVLEVGVRAVWEKMHTLLEQGKIVRYIDNNGRYFTYFPSSTESPYVHVRPHARDRQDVHTLPVADKLTGLFQYPKHSFWLNRSYVLKIIS